ncbi:GNAT family N-acetyltransferase [Aquimarina sp. 2201CG1-2-11]|uniref:GNAT family N-acetyltransferase n=1 Tax=Aquimarina discodermiae TaxID=3231043 RepID=UPI003463077B
MITYKEFETERLLITPTIEQDAELIYEMMNSPKFIQYVGNRNISSISEAKKYILDKMLPQLKNFGYSNYTITRKSDTIKVGICGLYDRDGVKGIDIGFGLLPKYEGKGYAFESANRLKEAAFNEFGITVINAITSKHNIASQKLLEKLGLECVGTTILPNEAEELFLYKITSQ